MITNALVQARQLYEDTDGVLVCDKYGYVELMQWFHEGILSDYDRTEGALPSHRQQ